MRMDVVMAIRFPRSMSAKYTPSNLLLDAKIAAAAVDEMMRSEMRGEGRKVLRVQEETRLPPAGG